jgi:DNA-binding NarL/FixJ family response regulator
VEVIDPTPARPPTDQVPEPGPSGATAAGPIRVAIVDDDPLVRAGLSLMLGGRDDVRIVAEAADGDEVPSMVDAAAPDVVLMDLRMPRTDGLAATERLMKQPKPPHVILLTTFDSEEHVLRALRAGAAGFLLKDTPLAQILDAIRRVSAGEAMLSPAVTRRLIAHVTAERRGGHRRDDARRRLAALTPRELEVARLLGCGQTNAELGVGLYMSTATVKSYVSRLLAKLGLENRVQVAILVHDAELD